MAEAQSLVLDDRPVAPLYFNVSRYIVSPRVGGFVDNPADIHLSRSMAIDD
jgi:ABC-type transport system substrate-binding protein